MRALRCSAIALDGADDTPKKLKNRPAARKSGRRQAEWPMTGLGESWKLVLGRDDLRFVRVVLVGSNTPLRGPNGAGPCGRNWVLTQRRGEAEGAKKPSACCFYRRERREQSAVSLMGFNAETERTKCRQPDG